MRNNMGASINSFLIGIGIGAFVGVLFAPWSGRATRQYLMDKAEEGKESAQRKAHELEELAINAMERGRHAIMDQAETLAAAFNAGQKAYRENRTNGSGLD